MIERVEGGEGGEVSVGFKGNEEDRRGLSGLSLDSSDDDGWIKEDANEVQYLE